AGCATPNRRGTGMGLLKANVGCVRTVTAMNVLGPGTKKSSLPSGDHIGRPPCAISYLAPVGGNGCTYSVASSRRSLIWYAIQRPSGEKTASVGTPTEITSPKRDTVRSRSENVQSVVLPSFVTLKSNTSSTGDQDSGVWIVPGSARV